MTAPLRQQLEDNYKAFQAQLPALVSSQRGKFALMRHGRIAEFFDTARDAYVAGQKLFATDTPVDLGFFSHAVPQP